MTVPEREKVIRLLQRSEREFLEAAVDGLSEAQWAFRPTPDGWSVGEVAAHLLLTEVGLLSMIEEMLASPPDLGWQARTAGQTEVLETALPNRCHRARAPDRLVPAPSPSHAETLTGYKQARARTLAFAQEIDVPLHTRTRPNPFFGALNGYQWLLYIPLHNLRHNQQIQEIKSTPGFPR